MVAPDALRKLLKSDPFVPFKIHLSDGGLLEVKYANSVFLPPKWQALLVTYAKPEGFDFVPLVNVRDVEVQASKHDGKKSRKRKD